MKKGVQSFFESENFLPQTANIEKVLVEHFQTCGISNVAFHLKFVVPQSKPYSTSFSKKQQAYATPEFPKKDSKEKIEAYEKKPYLEKVVKNTYIYSPL